ncbi:MAG: hypothetical protein LQ343_004674 [Gyalolechia ehrenbergii]|nr:MAG: hypothetical protein LQ343_004674 [Gyalolechia ehrenbergii]
MADKYDDCTAVTEFCVIDATIYGYRPDLAANIFFLVIFGILGGIQMLQGLRWRTWTFMIAMVLGCLTEVIGYIGRILLNDNPWSGVGFNIQICCIIIAPAFFSAAIYLTLKHLALTLGSQYSLLQPKWYTWIFIGCDLLSLILQGAGGGTAASASSQSTQDVGSNLMITGIVWQVVTLLVFAVLAGDFFLRLYRNRSNLTHSASEILRTTKFMLFLAGLTLAYLGIEIRCIYRIAELAGGWKNDIMQNETEFIVLEGVMIVIAALAVTAFHPGYCFPQMSQRKRVGPNGIMGEKEVSEHESPDAAV